MACHSDNNNKKGNKNTLSAVFFGSLYKHYDAMMILLQLFSTNSK